MLRTTMSAKKKRGPGRPKGTHEPAVYTASLLLRLTPPMKAALTAAASREGLDASEWLRRAAQARLDAADVDEASSRGGSPGSVADA